MKPTSIALIVLTAVLAVLAGVPMGALADQRPADKSDARAALAHFYANVDTLVAHFEQVQKTDRGRVLQKASGTFYLARPDRFRWVYEKPYNQTIVSNGDVLKFYDAGMSQVTVRRAGASLRGTPARLLAGGAALDKTFKIEAKPAENRLNWLVLKPRAERAQFQKIELGLADNLPKLMILHDKLGQTTRITFSDIRVNPDIQAGRFELDVPANVNVVDRRKRQNRG